MIVSCHPQIPACKVKGLKKRIRVHHALIYVLSWVMLSFIFGFSLASLLLLHWLPQSHLITSNASSFFHVVSAAFHTSMLGFLSFHIVLYDHGCIDIYSRICIGQLMFYLIE